MHVLSWYAYTPHNLLICFILLTLLVLVAHNGFAFDFLFLMAEIKRHKLEESFDTAKLYFADTLFDARRVSIYI